MQTTKIEYKKYNILQNIKYFYDFYRKNCPIFLLACILEIVLGAILPYLLIYLPKLAIELVSEEYTNQKVFQILLLFGVLCVCVAGIKGASEMGKYFIYNEKRNNFMGELFLKNLRVNFSYTESGEAKELYWKALHCISRGDYSAMHKITYGTLSIIENVLSFILYSTVLAYLNPWIVVLLVVLSLLQYVISIAKIKYLERFRDEAAKISSQCAYVFYSIMGNEKVAKDIRMFSMDSWMDNYKDNLLTRQKNVTKKKNKIHIMHWQAGSFLALERDIFAYIYLIKEASTGQINAADFVLYFGAITGFSVFVNSIMESLAELKEGSIDTNYYRTYMELDEDNNADTTHSVAKLNKPIEISFEDVSFRYSDDSDWIFRHLNLTIHAGEKLAIVGVNGAGKTTLVKLMCRLYEPQEGRILLNNIPINKFPVKEIYTLFSAVFQDTFIPPFTVGENLALSTEYDEERSINALKEAGLWQQFEEQKTNLNTYFGKDMDENGIELSGGQEQRFLLARALYKDAPVLILDEPTAALDPIAESEIYDKYASMSHNKTAVFISHRLASTRFSDRIIMIGEQGILEEGTHEELLANGGAYAEMFMVQKQYYEKEQREKEAFE